MSERCNRLSAILLRDLNTILRQRFRDEAKFFSISFVKISGDLRIARIYYLAQSPEHEVAARQFFKKHRAALRHLLAQKIVIHHFPALYFYADRQIERQLRVYQILDELREETGGE